MFERFSAWRKRRKQKRRANKIADWVEDFVDAIFDVD